MRWWLAAWLLLVVVNGDREWYHFEADSPCVGAFPGRRLSSEWEPRRLQVAPLYGSINEFAYYFIDVLIGTPPRRQSVILDSGSSLLGFSCTGCGRNCGHHLDEPFDVSQSRTAERYSCYDKRCLARGSCKTSEKDTCLYSQVYSEGSSIEGFFFSDKIALGDQTDHNAFVTYDYIGCHTRETVLFTTQQASGILGVSFPKGGRQPTVMDVLMNSRDVNSKVFSLCVAEDGGLLSVGGYNSSYHKPSYSHPTSQFPIQNNITTWFRHFLRGGSNSPAAAAAAALPNIPRTTAATPTPDIVWVKLTSDSAYSIDLARIILGAKPLVQGGFGDVLVDSGTTYSYFPNDIYHTLARELIDLCTSNNAIADHKKRAGQCVRGKSDLVCFHFKDEAVPVADYLARIPSFYVQFGNGGIVEWAAESWLFRKSERVWCSAIENNRRKQTILGMSFMKKKEVIFDRDNSYIGFVSADCPPHNAYKRPDPPQQELAPEDYIQARDQGLELPPPSAAGGGGDPQSMKHLPPSLVNDTHLWSWTGHNVPPYINAPVDPAAAQGGNNSSHDTNKMSWLIGGGVGASVVGALIALVAKSTSRTRYDPVIGPPRRWDTVAVPPPIVVHHTQQQTPNDHPPPPERFEEHAASDLLT